MLLSAIALCRDGHWQRAPCESAPDAGAVEAEPVTITPQVAGDTHLLLFLLVALQVILLS